MSGAHLSTKLPVLLPVCHSSTTYAEQRHELKVHHSPMYIDDNDDLLEAQRERRRVEPCLAVSANQLGA